MPSTYTLNNGIELIATGEQSGTWGDTTNTNLSLLDTALDGQVTVTLPSAGTSGSPNTLAISDGAASDGRNRMVIFNDGGDLGATAYVQLTPNDAEKIIYIRNALAGSRSIILFQGTYNASNDYEVPAGTTAVIYFDGAGSGAVAANVFNNAHFDALNIVGAAAIGTTLTVGTSLNIASSTTVDGVLDEDNMASDSATKLATQQSIKAYVDTQVGANNELSEVLANGNTTGGTDIAVSANDDITFADNSKAIFGAGSDLQIYSDGTNSVIAEGTTGGNLIIRGANINLQNEGGTESYAVFANNGAATLYYDNAPKLATTSTGIDVTGTAVTDGLTVAGDTTLRNATFSDTTDSNTQLAVVGGSQILYIQAGSAYSGVLLSSNQYVAQEYRTRDNDIKFSYDNGTTAHLLLDYSAQQISTTGTSFSVNEGGGDYDFRVESDGNTHALFVDAAQSTVGVGTSSTFQTLTVNGNIAVGGAGNKGIYFGDNITSSLDQEWLLANNASSSNAFSLYEYDSGTFVKTRMIVESLGDFKIQSTASGSVVINDDSENSDFRVESDTNTHALFVDAGNNRIGINESGPGSTLTVNGDILSNWGNSGEQKIGINVRSANTFSSTGKTFIVTGADAVAGAQAMAGGDVIVRGGVGAGNEGLNIYAGHLYLEGGLHTAGVGTESGAGSIYMKTAGIERLRVNQYGSVIINETSDNSDFRVESDGYTGMLLVDASANQVTMGGTGSNDAAILTLGSPGQATYVTNVTEGEFGIVRYNNTQSSTQHSGIVFRVTTNNASNNSYGSFGLIQPSYNRHDSRFYFNLRSQSNNTRQYANIDSEVGWQINDGGESYIDFRVESDGASHMLFVDSGSNYIGINTSNPVATLVVSNGGASGIEFQPEISTNFNRITNFNRSASVYNELGIDAARIEIRPEGVRRLSVATSGVIVNEDSRSDTDFRVESDSQSHMFWVDAGSNTINMGGYVTAGQDGARIMFNGNKGYQGTGVANDMLNIRDTTSHGTTDNGGAIVFSGQYASGSYTSFAEIHGIKTNNTGGSYDGDLLFKRRLNGGSMYTQGMSQYGYLKWANDGVSNHGYHDSNTHSFSTDKNFASVSLSSTNLAMTRRVLITATKQSPSSSYYQIESWSGDGANFYSDREFGLRGDGNAYADGSWNGGGADYAEYFEWADGNTANEDRRGYSVVLEQNMIRKATSSDDASQIIGVVSANPAVVGDHAENRWTDKFAKDDFGEIILDEHEVWEWDETYTDDDGVEQTRKVSYESWSIPSDITPPSNKNVITQDENGKPLTHKRLNPNFDPDVEYVPRSERSEWDCIGLMGKLRLRKGQPTGANWIKMRDISADVEEWLVR